MDPVLTVKRQIRTFGVTVIFKKIDNQWVEVPGQASIDAKINNWVEETRNIIISVNGTFHDSIVNEDTMYTDFLYIVTFESAEDYLAAKKANQPAADVTPPAPENDFVGLNLEVVS